MVFPVADSQGLNDIKVTVNPSDADIVSPEEDEEEEASCDDFFLLDGRSPAELPETWVEAQEAFVEICESESNGLTDCSRARAEVFGEHVGEADLDINSTMCATLFEIIDSDVVSLAAAGGYTRSKGGSTYPSAIFVSAAALESIPASEDSAVVNVNVQWSWSMVAVAATAGAASAAFVAIVMEKKSRGNRERDVYTVLA